MPNLKITFVVILFSGTMAENYDTTGNSTGNNNDDWDEEFPTSSQLLDCFDLRPAIRVEQHSFVSLLYTLYLSISYARPYPTVRVKFYPNHDELHPILHRTYKNTLEADKSQNFNFFLDPFQIELSFVVLGQVPTVNVKVLRKNPEPTLGSPQLLVIFNKCIPT